MLACCGQGPSETAEPGVSDGDWLYHGRTRSEQRFSPLTQINTETVSNLKLAWYADLDTTRGQEATPIVVDGVMYMTSAWSKVHAFDVRTGELLWQFDPE
ncbi:MAG: PQQ-binding-like beta-propeller repeat protein, partial [Pseudomonadota bacterium]